MINFYQVIDQEIQKQNQMISNVFAEAKKQTQKDHEERMKKLDAELADRKNKIAQMFKNKKRV